MNESVDEFSLVREILNKPILSQEEEKRLGRQKNLKIEKTIKKVEILMKAKREEIRERAGKLRKKLKKLEKIKKEAREKLLERNQRLVLDLANKFSKGDRKLVQDLFQAGNIGLIKAVERFDSKRGCKFSTHAIWWIRLAMQKEKLDDGIVQLTSYLRGRVACYIKVYNDFSKKFKGQPSIKAIAKKMNLAESMVFSISTLCKMQRIAFDHPIKDDLDMKSFINIFCLDDSCCIEEDIHRKCLIDKVFKIAYDVCNKIDIEIVKMRFGLNGKKYTLKVIGARFGLSKERIRQREHIFLKKVRKEFEEVEI